MPRVPTIDNFGVMPNQLPGVSVQPVAPRVDPGQQLGALSRNVERAGAVAMGIEQQIQVEIDEARVKEADNALAEELRTLQHDPDGGYLNAQGRDAIDRRKGTGEAIRKLGQQYAQGFETPAQRAMFTQIAQRRIQSALDQVEVHAARQSRVYATTQAESRAANQVPDMVSNWADPARFSQARATGLAEIDALAALNGIDGEAKQAIRSEYLTKAHTQVLDHIISLDRPTDARAYFERFQGEIDATRHDAIRKALQQVSVKSDSLSLAMTISGTGGSLGEQLKALDGMFKGGKVSAEIYDATRQRVEHNWQVRKAQQAEYEKALVGQAQDWVLRNPSASVLDMPPGMYANLRNTGHLDRVSSFARSAGKPETDPTAYYGLRRMAAEEPEKFVGLNLLETRHLLSPSDWEEMVKVQTSISRGDAQELAKQRVVGDTVKRLRADILAAGIDLSPKEGSPQAGELATFMGSITRALDDAQRQKGAPLAPDEAMRIGREQLREGWMQGTGIIFRDKGRRYQAGGSNAFIAAPYGQIPRNVRDEIEAELRARGAPINTEEVERIYQRAIDAGRIQ